MPELSELCGESSSPLSMVLPAKKVTLGTLTVDSTSSPQSLEPSHPLASVDDGDLASSVIHSRVTFGKVVPVGEALFVKELCELLASVEKASPGKGKAIACLLVEMTTSGKSKKVKDCPRDSILKVKSTRSKGKKSGAMGKAYAAA